MTKRLETLFNNNAQKENSLQWYYQAHEYALHLAHEYNTPLHHVCAVIAVLSPAVSWDVNKRDAHKLIKAYAEGVNMDAVSVSTYGSNKNKAIGVLMGVITMQKTPTNYKTYSFYKNILNPCGESYVTIDRHAIKAYKGMKKGGSVSITPKTYKLAEKAYKKLAKKLGYTPSQVQAVVWDQYKTEMGR